MGGVRVVIGFLGRVLLSLTSPSYLTYSTLFTFFSPFSVPLSLFPLLLQPTPFVKLGLLLLTHLQGGVHGLDGTDDHEEEAEHEHGEGTQG